MRACESQLETWCRRAKSSAAEATCRSTICASISGWAAVDVSIRRKSCGRMGKRKRSLIWLLIGFMSCVKGRAWSPANCQNTASSFLNMSISGATATRFRAVLLLAVLFVGGDAVRAQNTGRPAESPLTRQLHQALSLAEHGTKRNAMNLVLRLLEQHPDFAPALKLKGMLLEEAGRITEAGAAYEEALKLAPNDGDLLLKAGIFKMAAGQKGEALQLLQHRIRGLPGDGDPDDYL